VSAVFEICHESRNPCFKGIPNTGT
jgi:hypothetical protein